MKTVIILLCILGIGATAVLATIESNTAELIQSTNKLINLNKASDIEILEDHATHNDSIQIHGEIWCETRQLFYRVN